LPSLLFPIWVDHVQEVSTQKSILGSNATGMQCTFFDETQNGTPTDLEEALGFLDGVNGVGLNFQGADLWAGFAHFTWDFGF
jgi:hypothetical protein